jgi:hypothetical protein
VGWGGWRENGRELRGGRLRYVKENRDGGGVEALPEVKLEDSRVTNISSEKEQKTKAVLQYSNINHFFENHHKPRPNRRPNSYFKHIPRRLPSHFVPLIVTKRKQERHFRFSINVRKQIIAGMALLNGIRRTSKKETFHGFISLQPPHIPFNLSFLDLREPSFSIWAPKNQTNPNIPR